MQVLLRIDGSCRYSADCHGSDHDVRCRLGMPSVECMLSRLRLAYLLKILKTGPSSLLAMLHLRSGPDNRSVLPWVELIRSDLLAFYRFHTSKLSALPDPCTHADIWFHFIRTFPMEWSQLVKSFIYHESHVADGVCVAGANFASNTCCTSVLPELVCNMCGADAPRRIFKTNKALLAHQRTVHHFRNPIGRYVDGSGVCPACSVDFGSRHRVVAHLSETRVRAKVRYRTCRDRVLEGEFEPLQEDELVQLLVEHRKQARAAYAAGRSHVVAIKPCRRARLGNQFSAGARDHVTVGRGPSQKRTANVLESVRPLKRLRTKSSVFTFGDMVVYRDWSAATSASKKRKTSWC